MQRSLSETTSAKCIIESQLEACNSQLITRDLKIEDLSTQLTSALASIADLKERVFTGENQRKMLHNRVQDLKVRGEVGCMSGLCGVAGCILHPV